MVTTGSSLGEGPEDNKAALWPGDGTATTQLQEYSITTFRVYTWNVSITKTSGVVSVHGEVKALDNNKARSMESAEHILSYIESNFQEPVTSVRCLFQHQIREDWVHEAC